MILLFLHSWRSTLIVATSIPLSILTSVIVLNMLNQTLNVMTLGGLALAVGILVDDATVEIENNHRHLALGKPLRQAILDGAAEVATPAFVATLSICIVFVPILFISGSVGRSLHRWQCPSCSRCSRATSSPGRSSPRWCCTCWRQKSGHATTKALRAAGHSSAVFPTPSRPAFTGSPAHMRGRSTGGSHTGAR